MARPGRYGFGVVVLTGSLILGGSASASTAKAHQTIRFTNWVERTYAGSPRVVFRIRSVTVDRTSWRVHVDIANRSRQTIRIRRRNSSIYRFWRSQDFGVYEPGPPCDPAPYEPPCKPVQRLATRFTPSVYRSLRPGQIWRGSFGGYGSLQRRVLLYLSFGVFVPERGNPFSWQTQRGFHLR